MYSIPAFLAAAQTAQSTDDGLTFTEIIANIPHDPATIFTLILLVVAFGTIFWVGRSRGHEPPKVSG